MDERFYEALADLMICEPGPSNQSGVCAGLCLKQWSGIDIRMIVLRQPIRRSYMIGLLGLIINWKVMKDGSLC